MKILYISTHPHLNLAAPSGPGTHMREVIAAFRQEGHEVIPFIAGGTELNQSASIQFKTRGWKKFIPNFIWQTLKELKFLKHNDVMRSVVEDLIQRHQPNLVYERAYLMMTATAEVCRAKGIMHFLEMNAPYPEEKAAMEGAGLLHNKAQRAEFTQVSLASRVFVVSSALKKYLLKHGAQFESKIVMTPNAVLESFAQVSTSEIEAVKTQFHLKDNRVIGFVGSIFPYHGVDLLIRAFIELRAKYDGVKLIVVGDGEILPELKQLAAQSTFEGDIVFTGNIPSREVPNFIATMDITVMARSNWYGSPVKIFEYGALKKFIIAPDVVPVQDVMVHREDGWLIKDSQTELLGALEYALTHDKECMQAANKFYNKVMSEHTWSAVGKQILKEVNEAAHNY